VVAGADQAVANGSNSLLASAALVQDYTYLSQFGTQGSANGQFFIQPSQLLAQNVAIDPTSHNIVVSDFGNYRIQIFNSAGVYLSQFGTFGGGTNQLAGPQSVAVDPTSHNIVVTDRNAIKIFNSAGVYLSQFGTFGSGNGQFNDPVSIAIDPTSHNILVAETFNYRIQIFNSAGVYLSQFGTFGSGNGQFFHPFGVAIDPTSHNIVVSDLATNRVQIFNSAGVYLSQFGSTGSGNGQFRGAAGIAIDPVSHNIIVAESIGNRVQIFNSAGVYLSQFGSAGSGDGQFNSPGGIAIDPVSHNIVVSDLHNNRVQIFAPAAVPVTACPNAPRHLLADNAGAFGLYEGSLTNVVLSASGGPTTGILTIAPTALLHVPVKGNVQFPLVGHLIYPNGILTPVQGNFESRSNIVWSKFPSPEYAVSLCEQGSTTITVSLTDREAVLYNTVNDLFAVAGKISPALDTGLALVDVSTEIYLNVPLFKSAVDNLALSINSTDLRSKSTYLLRATRSLSLLLDATVLPDAVIAHLPAELQEANKQAHALIKILKISAVELAFDLALAPARIIFIAGEMAVYVLQTAFNPIEIKLVGF
jgi:DNA-binding beta-propeller fold protein YncE